MSRLNELIEELCPDGVVYKGLGDCMSELRTGLNPRKNFVLNDNNADCYYVTVAEMKNGSIVFSRSTDRITREAVQLINQRSRIREGDILFSSTGTIGKTCLVKDEPTNWNVNETLYVVTPCTEYVTGHYLLHVMRWLDSRDCFMQVATGSTVKHIAMRALKSLRIPVPPIEVQREIVRILDAMQELEETLASEFDKRQTQFDLAISKKLSEERVNRAAREAVPFIAVKDIREEVITPVRAKPTDFSGEIPWCKLEDVEGFSLRRSLSGKGVSTETIETMGLKVYPKGTVLCSCSATLGKYCIVETPLVTNQRFMGFVCKEGVLNRYFMYAVKAGTTALVREATGTTNPYISRAAFESLMIQMPSIDVQSRIVDELDTMYELINHIEEELRMRRLQFEYYRDKLLNFPEKAV